MLHASRTSLRTCWSAMCELDGCSLETNRKPRDGAFDTDKIVKIKVRCHDKCISSPKRPAGRQSMPCAP